VLAIQYVKSIPRWLLLKTLGRTFTSLATSPLGVMQQREVPEPRLPNLHWVRIRPILSGICGSDLASITAEGSPFFAPLTSFPFTFGHEVVGRVEEVGSEVQGVRVGERVVIEPALHCGVRGIDPPCTPCQEGLYGNCVNVTAGDISPGIQTGYCRDTGGGWSTSLVAHQVQLHRVPETLTDEEAVLAEPFACALHAALAPPALEGNVLVLGCGTMGLLTIAALKATRPGVSVVAVAKHSHQQKLASELGADVIVPAGRNALKELCRISGASQHQAEIGPPTILGGFPAVFDCVGSPRSLDESLRLTRSQGHTMLVGMPAIPRTVDWTTIWYKELHVRGAYAYGQENLPGGRERTFGLALRLMEQRRVNLGRLVTHRFPLAEYRQAVRTALLTGPFGSVKTVFSVS